MTVVIALKGRNGVYIGADSALSSGYVYEITKEPKIKNLGFCEYGVVLVGVAGSPRVTQHFPEVEEISGISPKRFVENFANAWRETLETKGMIETTSGVQSSQSDCLVVVKNEIFKIDSCFHVSQTILPYRAIGSGAELALGSLFSTRDNSHITDREKVTLALRSASEFNVHCKPPFHILFSGSFRKKEKK